MIAFRLSQLVTGAPTLRIHEGGGELAEGSVSRRRRGTRCSSLLARRFFAAAEQGDLAGLDALLASDVELTGDGGGKAPALARSLRGRNRAARGESKPENLLYITFAYTDSSQRKGMEFLGRFMQRREGRDAPTTDAARDAQYDAIVDWGIPDYAALQRVTGIRSPTLVIQGDNDLMIPTKLSYPGAGLIPDAQIRIYPDAAHGLLAQYPIATDVSAFLAAADPDQEREQMQL